MIIYVLLGLVVLISVLTLLPSWLRRRRPGADYAEDYDRTASRAEQRQSIRDWDTLDHADVANKPRP